MQGFSFSFQRQSGFVPLEYSQSAFTKKNQILDVFFSDSLANKGILKEDKGMQNHLADSIVSGCYINLIIQTNVMRYSESNFLSWDSWT